MAHHGHDLVLFDKFVLLDPIFCPLEVERQLLLILRGDISLVEQLVGLFDIIRVKNGVRIDLCLQIIDRRRRYGSGKQGGRIIRCKRSLDVLICIHKVQHEGLLLKRRADTVQAGKRLNGGNALQFLENIHSAELRLVEPGLILVGNQQHLVVVLVEFLCQPILRETVHGSLRIFGIIVRKLHLAGESDQRLDIGVAFFLSVILKCLAVFDRTLSGSGDDHCFCHTTEFRHNRSAEMLHNDLYTLCNVCFVQFHKTGNLSFRISSLAARIFFDFLVQLIEGIVSGVVLKHVENEAFLNGLLHRVNMECLTLTFCVQATEQLNGRRLRCGSESKHGHVGLFTVSTDFIRNHIFHIGSFLLSGTKRLCDRCHVLTCGGGMCLIDNNRKTLVFQPCNAVHDIREFLNRGCNDFSIAVQSNRKVSGVAFIVHHTDKSSFVLHAHNSPLELTINHNTIGHDHNIVKNNLIICIVQ